MSIGLRAPSAADPIPLVHDPAKSRQPQVDSGDSMCAHPRTCRGDQGIRTRPMTYAQVHH